MSLSVYLSRRDLRFGRMCPDGAAWLSSFGPGVPTVDVWRRCKRGDWILWVAERAGVDRALLLDACAPALERLREGFDCDGVAPWSIAWLSGAWVECAERARAVIGEGWLARLPSTT